MHNSFPAVIPLHFFLYSVVLNDDDDYNNGYVCRFHCHIFNDFAWYCLFKPFHLARVHTLIHFRPSSAGLAGDCALFFLSLSPVVNFQSYHYLLTQHQQLLGT